MVAPKGRFDRAIPVKKRAAWAAHESTIGKEESSRRRSTVGDPPRAGAACSTRRRSRSSCPSASSSSTRTSATSCSTPSWDHPRQAAARRRHYVGYDLDPPTWRSPSSGWTAKDVRELTGDARSADFTELRRTIDSAVSHVFAAGARAATSTCSPRLARDHLLLSPCVLPIVPGYLSLVTGLEVGEPRNRSPTHYLKRIAPTSRGCSSSASVVFVLLGSSPLPLGSKRCSGTRRRSPGCRAGSSCSWPRIGPGRMSLTMPGMYREFRFHPHLERFGPVAGRRSAAFAVRWTPCIGPVLGAVLGYAAKESDRGVVVLLVAYSLGLACRSSRSGSPWRQAYALDWFKRHGAPSRWRRPRSSRSSA